MAPIYRDSADWLRNGVQSGHMVSEDLDALHAMAKQLELAPRYWQGDCLTPHYQLPERLQAQADALGVVHLDRQSFEQMVERINHRLSQKQRPDRTRTAPPSRPRTAPPSPVRAAPRRAQTPEQPALL